MMIVENQGGENMVSEVSPINEEGKNRGIAVDNPYYGTFQGVANYYPFHNTPASYGAPYAYYQGQGYHIVPDINNKSNGFYTNNVVTTHNVSYVLQVYAAAERRPLRERRLPCCGLGLGWLLFIIGFFLGGISWYIGAFILICVQMDYREKPGLIACAVASFVTLIVITLGVTQVDLGKLT